MKIKTIKPILLILFLLVLGLQGCQPVLPDSTPIGSTPTSAGTLTTVPMTTPVISTPTGENPCDMVVYTLSYGNSSNLFTSCLDGSRKTQLTRNMGWAYDPAWSPDGTRVAFASSEGHPQVYVIDAEGRNFQQLTTDFSNSMPVWIPGSKAIAVRTTDLQGLWWWRSIDLVNGKITTLTEPTYDFFFQTPAWSPDGNRIAVMSLIEQAERNDGASQIHVQNADGSGDMALTADTWANLHPAWSPDGNEIAFLSERDGNYNVFAVYVMNADGTNVRRLSEPRYSEGAALSWSPEGKRLLISDALNGFTQLLDIETLMVSDVVLGEPGQQVTQIFWKP